MNADFEELVSRSRATSPADAESVARLEALLGEMRDRLDAWLAKIGERQAALDPLVALLERSRGDAMGLARDIARGEEALARLRSRATLRMGPPITLVFVEDGERREAA